MRAAGLGFKPSDDSILPRRLFLVAFRHVRSVQNPPPVLDVAEFLGWDAPDSGQWQLVDGEPRVA